MLNSAELDYIAGVLKSKGYHVHQTKSFLKVYHHGDFLLKVTGSSKLTQVVLTSALNAYNWNVKRIYLKSYRKTSK